MTPRLLAITPPAGAIAVAPFMRCIDDAAQVLEPASLCVLLREPGAAPDDLVSGRFVALIRACRSRDIPLLLSADAAQLAPAVEVLSRAALHGVQLRGDPPADVLARARDALGAARLLGRSVHGVPPAPPQHTAVDYSCFAPVFTPRTTPTKPAAGVAALRRWTAQAHASVVALGGVTPDNAATCFAAGAAGVASISTFFGVRAIVAEDLRQLVEVAAQCSAGASKTKKTRPPRDDPDDPGRPGSRG